MSSVLKFTGKCLLSLFMFHQILVAGQCGGDCSSCDADASACNADPACRVLTDGAIDTGASGQICVDIGTCDSDCTVCSNAECTLSRANCFISGVTNTCVGGDCQLSCLECSAGDGSDCNASEAEPNGCVFDGAAETCVFDTAAPTTAEPTTATPTTAAPTTASPTTAAPTTASPTTASPTTAAPTTAAPTTATPTTTAPTTASPTTSAPTTASPTTAAPTTADPTTAPPTSLFPTTPSPTTASPTTASPTTASPTTASPTTASPTTAAPTTASPTTASPTTASPTTASPTTASPTTASPTTASPTTVAPTTTSPTTAQPTADQEDCPDCPITMILTSIDDIPVGLCPDNVTLGSGSSSASFSFDSVDDDSDSSDSSTTSTNATVCLVNATSSSSGSSSSSESSDSGSASSGFCGSAGGSSSSNSVSMESVSTRRRRRRRTLLSESSSDSADSSSGVDSSTLVAATQALVDTCLHYSVGIDDACGPINLVGLFLPLCENNDTDFNSSALTADDLTALISEETFADGTNVATARGVVLDGTPGIALHLTAVGNSGASFVLCLQNITVTTDNVDDLANVTGLETSTGVAFIETATNDTVYPVTGLPCFNFFFAADCPTTDGSSAGSDSVSSESDDVDDSQLGDAALEQLAELIATDLLAYIGQL